MKNKIKGRVMNVAINGFGRIGRTFLRTVLRDKEAQKKIAIVAINIGPGNVEYAAHMFKYDTLMGTYPGDVHMKNGDLIIDNQRIKIIAEKDPVRIDWRSLKIDWVVEATGKFTTRESAQLHCQAGASHVLITAPAHDEDISIIPGVNEDMCQDKHKIISLGSCTTNAFIPMLRVLHDSFTITQGYMTTIHAYTNSQVLLDVENKDLRFARAAGLNIIPASTGASKMIGKVMPELENIIFAQAIRVPVGKCSLIDLTITTKKEVTVDKIHDAFNAAAQGRMKGIVALTMEPLVSSDFSGNSYSVTIDGQLTSAQGNMAKVFGWYDNEWGYSERLKDFLMSI
jgi:glyceraldehyde-3-phosphate dehydrogenase type I